MLHLQSPFVSHFLGDTALNSEYSLHLQASLHSIYRPQYTYGSQQAGRQTHSHTQSEHAQTHTHTTADAARIPNVRSSTTERSKCVCVSVRVHFAFASLPVVIRMCIVACTYCVRKPAGVVNTPNSEQCRQGSVTQTVTAGGAW